MPGIKRYLRGQVWRRLTPHLVAEAYRGLLNREPDSEGMAHAVATLEGGDISYGEFLRGVADSEEFNAASTRALSQMLHLGADVTVHLAPPFETVRLQGPLSDTSVFNSIIEARGVWEPHVTAVVRHLLRPGMTFLDVGANIGYFTALAGSLVGPQGSVLAFEPMPSIHRYCAENVRINEFSWARVMPVALWSERTAMEMLEPTRFLGGAHLLTDGMTAGDQGSVTISGAPLDALVDSGEVVIPGCDLLKMDIEGAEPHALRGMRLTLERTQPVVCLELNTHCLEMLGGDSTAMLDPLDDLGYQVFALPKPSQFEHFTDYENVSPWDDVHIFALPDRAAFLATVAAMDALIPPADPTDLVALPAGRTWEQVAAN